MATGEERAVRARGCVGARFRPHGRDPRHGLDCVGVAAITFGRDVAGDYALRGGEAAGIGYAIEALGLVRVTEAGVGDLLLIAAGMGQWHLAIRTDAGFVHADARLRRVVETPGEPAAVGLAWTEGR